MKAGVTGWLYVCHPPLDPSTKLRVSCPAPGEATTLTLLGEPAALALSHQREGGWDSAPARPFD